MLAALGVVILSFWTESNITQIKHYPLFQALPDSFYQGNPSNLSQPSTCTSILGPVVRVVCPLQTVGFLRSWPPFGSSLHPPWSPGEDTHLGKILRIWMDGWKGRKGKGEEGREKRGRERRMDE